MYQKKKTFFFDLIYENNYDIKQRKCDFDIQIDNLKKKNIFYFQIKKTNY